MAEQEAGDPAQGSSDGYQEWTPLPISSLSPNYHHVQQAFWSWSHQTSQSILGQLDQWATEPAANTPAARGTRGDSRALPPPPLLLLPAGCLTPFLLNILSTPVFISITSFPGCLLGTTRHQR